LIEANLNRAIPEQVRAGAKFSFSDFV
jgi:hypothetical protein